MFGDSSFLAVAHGSFVSVWNLEGPQLPDCRRQINMGDSSTGLTSFVFDSPPRSVTMLAAASGRGLSIWELGRSVYGPNGPAEYMTRGSEGRQHGWNVVRMIDGVLGAAYA